MRTITQGELRITGDACFGAVEKAQLYQAFGEHGTLEALVWLKSGTEGNDGDRRWNGMPVCLMASDKKDDFLFSGVVRRAAFVRINGRRAVELTAASYTYLLDREKHTRTFQQESRTYRKLAEMIMSRMRGACIWNGEGGNDAVGSFLMQYMESDWEFLRRVASMQGQALIPEVRWAGARTYIGLMDSGEVKTLEAGEYRIKKTLARIPGQEDNVGRGYLCGNRKLEVWDRYEEYEPGERVSVNGSILTVVEKTSYIKNSQWLNCYGFMEPHACRTETIRSPRPSGVAVKGSVIEAGTDTSRLQLVTDGIGESSESTHLCPVYYAGSGRGYSGQPEKGDVQYLYFPTGQDKDRYIIGSVDAGTEKMEQLDRQEGDENAGGASKTESTGTELSEVKSWSTPGNRRMVLSRGGISFANSRKGGMNVRSSGIRVWSNGEMTLKSKDITGEGHKITAEAGDYVWIGSGSSGIAVLPDQIQISASNVYMESPLSWIHKTINETAAEILLKQYEDIKASVAPPILTEDGKVITRDGYDDILYSQDMYDFFEKNVVGKLPGYERNHDEPYATLYEQWLDEVYGHSAMWHFWNYAFSIDGIQTLLDIGGFFYDGCDLVNAAIYLLRGKWKDAGWSFIGAVPLIGSVIMAKKGTKLVSAAGNLSTALKTEDAVTGLTLTYKLEDTGTKLASAAGDWSTAMKTGDAVSDLSSMYKLEDVGTKVLKEVIPVAEEMCETVKNSANGIAVAGQTVYKDLSVTTKIVDDAGEATEIIVNTANGGWSFGTLSSYSSLNNRQRKLLELLSNSGDTIFIPKKSVSMNDLRQLTNVTGDEFNMFTIGGRRLIIRGYGNEIKVSPEMYDDILKGVYGKFSGHTHPGYSLEPGPADEPFLRKLGQRRSSIWGNTREGWLPFGQDMWLTEKVREEIRRKIMRKLYEN